MIEQDNAGSRRHKRERERETARVRESFFFFFLAQTHETQPKQKKQNKTKPRFGYRAKYRIWRENKVESLEERQISLVGSLSLSLSLTQGFYPKSKGQPKKQKLWRGLIGTWVGDRGFWIYWSPTRATLPGPPSFSLYNCVFLSLTSLPTVSKVRFDI